MKLSDLEYNDAVRFFAGDGTVSTILCRSRNIAEQHALASVFPQGEYECAKVLSRASASDNWEVERQYGPAPR